MKRPTTFRALRRTARTAGVRVYRAALPASLPLLMGEFLGVPFLVVREALPARRAMAIVGPVVCDVLHAASEGQ